MTGGGDPNLLPPAPRLCLDRAVPLRRIAEAEDAAVAAEQSTLINLYGDSGVGKTTLALHVADRRWTAYPCALYYDLRGAGSGTPAEPAEVLAHWARMLGLPGEQTTGDVQQLAAAVRNATRRRRVMVVLDDAFSAAQIHHLLPSSPSSLVIVTSRRRMIGPDLDFTGVRLDRFTEDFSIELLSRSIDPAVLDAEPEAARELADLCGHVPLILKVAAARIGTWRRAAPVASFVGRVRTPAALAELHLDGDRLVEEIYNVCYRELGADEQRAYRLLALHPEPEFAVDAAAAMLAAGSEPTADALAELERVGLLEAVSGDRYRFHHLIRAHAHARATEETDEREWRRAVGAAVTHYRRFAVGRIRSMSGRPLEGAFAAETEPTYRGDAAAARAAADLETEYRNLRAAVTAAEDLEMYAECVQLCFALRPFLYDTDRIAELTEIATIGSRAAERDGDRVSRMQMLCLVAMAAEKQGERLPDGEHRNAVSALHEARRLAYELGDHLIVARTFEWEGLLAEQRGDLPEALRHLRKALTVVEESLSGDDQLRAAALLRMHLGRTSLRAAAGDVTGVRAAVAHLDEAKSYFDAREQWVNSGRISHLLGEASLATGRWDAAERHLAAAATAVRTENFASQGVRVLPLLAGVRLRRGDRPAAREALREAIGYAERLGRADLVAELSRRLDEVGE